MIINTTGNRIVDEMAKINFTGNVIPNSWFYTFRNEKGNVNAVALMILSEIVYWYRPTLERTETGERYVKRFSSDLLQKSYKDLCDKFGISKPTLQRNLVYLESIGVIKRVFRTINTKNDVKLGNVMYIELNVERLKEMTFPKSEAVENEQKETVIEEDLEGGVCKNEHTLCSKMNRPYVQK